jgi:hypothetical protein
MDFALALTSFQPGKLEQLKTELFNNVTHMATCELIIRKRNVFYTFAAISILSGGVALFYNRSIFHKNIIFAGISLVSGFVAVKNAKKVYNLTNELLNSI